MRAKLLVVKKMCSEAGFEGRFTNHSLRATAATRLYAAGGDEQLITEKAGHRSSSVRAYKRIRVMSNSTGSVKFYMEVIEEVIVERKKLKKLRMKKRKRVRKFELKQEI